MSPTTCTSNVRTSRQELLDLALMPPAERGGERCGTAHPGALQPRHGGFLLAQHADLRSASGKRCAGRGDELRPFAATCCASLKAAWDAVRHHPRLCHRRVANFGYSTLVRRLLPEDAHRGGRHGGVHLRPAGVECARPTRSSSWARARNPCCRGRWQSRTRPESTSTRMCRAGRAPTSRGAFDLKRLTAVDFAYVETIFPALPEYLGDTIGVHTKRGCPFQCHFCLYNQIEGPAAAFPRPGRSGPRNGNAEQGLRRAEDLVHQCAVLLDPAQHQPCRADSRRDARPADRCAAGTAICG